MIQLSSKNNDSLFCCDVIIMLTNFKKGEFLKCSCDIDYNSKTDVF